MSTKEELLNTKVRHAPERLTLFSICCPCLMPKKLKCRASDIALLMYGKDEPHEYVVEKLAIKRVPLRLFGVEEDFAEYRKNNKPLSNVTNEKEMKVTNYAEEKPKEVEQEEECEHCDEQFQQPPEAILEAVDPPPPEVTAATISLNTLNSLQVNYDTTFDQSIVSFNCQPLYEHKSGEELILRTITANQTDQLITEVDQRVAKMSPDLEKTINTLKAVKPRPVSTQGTPMPIKNQKKRLSSRKVEEEGILTKDAYNYAPCSNDNPLQGIHYSLNRTTFTHAIEESSKSVEVELPMLPILDQLRKTKFTVEEATTNYQDATVLAASDEIPEVRSDNIQSPSQSLFDVSSIGSIVNSPEGGYRGYSSESLHYRESIESRPLDDVSGAREDVQFSVCNAAVMPTPRRSMTPMERSEKRNMKWKIVINSESKNLTIPTTSSSDQTVQNKRRNTKRRKFWKSRV